MKKTISIVVVLIISLGIYLFVTWFRFRDSDLHVIFCDVGQGDGIVIRTPTHQYVTIDGGPDSSFSGCLASHMPFWVRTIHLSLLSHPHADHFLGLLPVLGKYELLRFQTENLANSNTAYHLLQDAIRKEKIPSGYLVRGDQIHLGKSLQITVLGPTTDFLKNTSPGNMIGESKEFASLDMLLHYGKLTVLFPGDTQAGQLADDIKVGDIANLQVLQSPHHGSASGLTSEILSQLHPKLTVISVGLHNRYHHPAWQTLELLKAAHIPVKRTDQSGTIEIVSDGKKWWVE